jgi:hypothetical protein
MLLVAMGRSVVAAAAAASDNGDAGVGSGLCWLASRLWVRLMCTYWPLARPAVALSESGWLGLPHWEFTLLLLLVRMVRMVLLLLLLLLWLCRALCFVRRRSHSSCHAMDAGMHCSISTAKWDNKTTQHSMAAVTSGVAALPTLALTQDVRMHRQTTI